MKVLFSLVALLFCLAINSQVISGIYSQGLIIGFDEKSQIITGYYSNQTGYDEITKESRFFCQFYFIGKLINARAEIKSFYPNEPYTVLGEIILVSPTEFTILLNEEHGGCSNVTHFSDKPVSFNLNELGAWKSLAYVIADKVYFQQNPKNNQRSKSHIIKNDIVFIDTIVDKMAHCSFRGKTITSGWISTNALNTFID